MLQYLDAATITVEIVWELSLLSIMFFSGVLSEDGLSFICCFCLRSKKGSYNISVVPNIANIVDSGTMRSVSSTKSSGC